MGTSRGPACRKEDNVTRFRLTRAPQVKQTRVRLTPAGAEVLAAARESLNGRATGKPTR